MRRIQDFSHSQLVKLSCLIFFPNSLAFLKVDLTKSKDTEQVGTEWAFLPAQTCQAKIYVGTRALPVTNMSPSPATVVPKAPRATQGGGSTRGRRILKLSKQVTTVMPPNLLRNQVTPPQFLNLAFASSNRKKKKASKLANVWGLVALLSKPTSVTTSNSPTYNGT